MANYNPPTNGFKKGRVANPNGRPPLTPEVLAFRKITQESLAEAITKFSCMSSSQLNEIDLEHIPVHDAIIVNVLKNIKSGKDVSKAEILWTRLAGKPKENVSVTVVHQADPETFDNLLGLCQTKGE